MDPAPHVPMPADLAGRLSVRDVLSRGPGGLVARCHDPELDRDVIYKIAQPSPVPEDELNARFVREARLLASVGHPGVMRFLDVGEHDGRRFLLLEFLPGRTLQAEIDHRSRLPWEEAVAIARGVSAGLAALHAVGILHRDVKPANIVLDPGRGPVLIDLGLAKEMKDSRGITDSDVMVGTPEFLAPEMVSGTPPAPTADVYAVGVVLHTMITGVSPFRRKLPYDVIDAQVNFVPPRLEGVPAGLADLVTRCLAKNPAGRPPDGDDLGRALASVLEDPGPDGGPEPGSRVCSRKVTSVVSTPAPVARPVRPADPPVRGLRRVLLVLAVLALAVLLGILVRPGG